MIIKAPDSSLLPSLKALWKEAFGDTDEFIECFFKLGYSQSRALCSTEGDTLTAALYWFDMSCEYKKIAYIYGVSTAKNFRGKGISSSLMEEARQLLRAKGYEAITLVPAEEGLFRFYERLGYKTCSYIDERKFSASDSPLNVSKVNATEYFEKRKEYLKKGYLTLNKASFDFLNSLVDFYIGEDFVASVRKGAKELLCVEFLGNIDKIPGFINTLGYKTANVRTEGTDIPFAMYLTLKKNSEPPFSYLGFAFD